MQTFTRFVCHLGAVANSFRFDCFSRDGLVVYVQTESFTVPITENKFILLKATQNSQLSQQEYTGCKYHRRVVMLRIWTEIKWETNGLKITSTETEMLDSALR